MKRTEFRRSRKRKRKPNNNLDGKQKVPHTHHQDESIPSIYEKDTIHKKAFSSDVAMMKFRDDFSKDFSGMDFGSDVINTKYKVAAAAKRSETKIQENHEKVSGGKDTIVTRRNDNDDGNGNGSGNVIFRPSRFPNSASFRGGKAKSKHHNRNDTDYSNDSDNSFICLFYGDDFDRESDGDDNDDGDKRNNSTGKAGDDNDGDDDDDDDSASFDSPENSDDSSVHDKQSDDQCNSFAENRQEIINKEQETRKIPFRFKAHEEEEVVSDIEEYSFCSMDKSVAKMQVIMQEKSLPNSKSPLSNSPQHMKKTKRPNNHQRGLSQMVDVHDVDGEDENEDESEECNVNPLLSDSTNASDASETEDDKTDVGATFVASNWKKGRSSRSIRKLRSKITSGVGGRENFSSDDSSSSSSDDDYDYGDGQSITFDYGETENQYNVDQNVDPVEPDLAGPSSNPPSRLTRHGCDESFADSSAVIATYAASQETKMGALGTTDNAEKRESAKSVVESRASSLDSTMNERKIRPFLLYNYPWLVALLSSIRRVANRARISNEPCRDPIRYHSTLDGVTRHILQPSLSPFLPIRALQSSTVRVDNLRSKSLNLFHDATSQDNDSNICVSVIDTVIKGVGHFSYNHSIGSKHSRIETLKRESLAIVPYVERKPAKTPCTGGRDETCELWKTAIHVTFLAMNLSTPGSRGGDKAGCHDGEVVDYGNARHESPKQEQVVEGGMNFTPAISDHMYMDKQEIWNEAVTTQRYEDEMSTSAYHTQISAATNQRDTTVNRFVDPNKPGHVTPLNQELAVPLSDCADSVVLRKPKYRKRDQGHDNLAKSAMGNKRAADSCPPIKNPYPVADSNPTTVTNHVTGSKYISRRSRGVSITPIDNAKAPEESDKPKRPKDTYKDREMSLLHRFGLGVQTGDKTAMKSSKTKPKQRSQRANDVTGEESGGKSELSPVDNKKLFAGLPMRCDSPSPLDRTLARKKSPPKTNVSKGRELHKTKIAVAPSDNVSIQVDHVDEPERHTRQKSSVAELNSEGNKPCFECNYQSPCKSKSVDEIIADMEDSSISDESRYQSRQKMTRMTTTPTTAAHALHRKHELNKARESGKSVTKNSSGPHRKQPVTVAADQTNADSKARLPSDQTTELEKQRGYQRKTMNRDLTSPSPDVASMDDMISENKAGYEEKTTNKRSRKHESRSSKKDKRRSKDKKRERPKTKKRAKEHRKDKKKSKRKNRCGNDDDDDDVAHIEKTDGEDWTTPPTKRVKSIPAGSSEYNRSHDSAYAKQGTFQGEEQSMQRHPSEADKSNSGDRRCESTSPTTRSSKKQVPSIEARVNVDDNDNDNGSKESEIDTRIRLLCSERFIETWGEVVVKLANGEWADGIYKRASNDDGDDSNNDGTAQQDSSGETIKSRRITFLDTSLVDYCGVDIEYPYNSAIVLSAISTWRLVGIEEILRQVLELYSISKYRHVDYLICYDVNLDIQYFDDISRLQRAVMKQQNNGTFPSSSSPSYTNICLKVVSSSSLSGCIGEILLLSSSSYTTTTTSSYHSHMEKCNRIEQWITNEKERILFLLSIIPTLSVGGALECIEHFTITNQNNNNDGYSTRTIPNDWFYRLLGKNNHERNKLEQMASTSTTTGSSTSTSTKNHLKEKTRQRRRHEQQQQNQQRRRHEQQKCQYLQRQSILQLSFALNVFLGKKQQQQQQQ